MTVLTALEFFSGIGAFSAGCHRGGIEVLSAFDQNEQANSVFAANYHLIPTTRNLDTIAAADLPHADLWWLSPPCQPYSVRGKRQDGEDARAASLKRLIALLPERAPKAFFLENVAAFEGSAMHGALLHTLRQLGFSITQLHLCPTMFGVPMRRPRIFIAAAQDSFRFEFEPPPKANQLALKNFLDKDVCRSLYLSAETLDRYGQGFDIVDENNDEAVAICFTKGYARCMKASGSLLRDSSGKVRRFSPFEMLRLFGFDQRFRFPDHLSDQLRFKLIGNSVDVRAVEYLVAGLRRHHI